MINHHLTLSLPKGDRLTMIIHRITLSLPKGDPVEGRSSFPFLYGEIQKQREPNRMGLQVIHALAREVNHREAFRDVRIPYAMRAQGPATGILRGSGLFISVKA